jgi:hypothetical protein
MNFSFSAPAPDTATALTPAAVVANVEQILYRGAKITDAGVLFLAANRPEPTGEIRARLRPWAEVWPRLPARPLSEEATELILHAIGEVADRELDVLAARDALRAGPDPIAVEARVKDLRQRHAMSSLSTLEGEIVRLAHRGLREGLEHRVDAVVEHAEGARKALIEALRGRAAR